MTCPVCRKETDRDFRPFCSRRCADLDLARWLRGDYRVATDVVPADDATPLDSSHRLS
jgi:endogenous inhibitor of DNA gyrase (YacG/DUF329 family)